MACFYINDNSSPNFALEWKTENSYTEHQNTHFSLCVFFFYKNRAACEVWKNINTARQAQKIV